MFDEVCVRTDRGPWGSADVTGEASPFCALDLSWLVCPPVGRSTRVGLPAIWRFLRHVRKGGGTPFGGRWVPSRSVVEKGGWGATTIAKTKLRPLPPRRSNPHSDHPAVSHPRTHPSISRQDSAISRRMVASDPVRTPWPTCRTPRRGQSGPWAVLSPKDHALGRNGVIENPVPTRCGIGLQVAAGSRITGPTRFASCPRRERTSAQGHALYPSRPPVAGACSRHGRGTATSHGTWRPRARVRQRFRSQHTRAKSMTWDQRLLMRR